MGFGVKGVEATSVEASFRPVRLADQRQGEAHAAFPDGLLDRIQPGSVHLRVPDSWPVTDLTHVKRVPGSADNR